MTRKDYKRIAAAINGVMRDHSDSMVDIVEALAFTFKEDNIRFSTEKFREACYEGVG